MNRRQQGRILLHYLHVAGSKYMTCGFFFVLRKKSSPTSRSKKFIKFPTPPVDHSPCPRGGGSCVQKIGPTPWAHQNFMLTQKILQNARIIQKLCGCSTLFSSSFFSHFSSFFWKKSLHSLQCFALHCFLVLPCLQFTCKKNCKKNQNQLHKLSWCNFPLSTLRWRGGPLQSTVQDHLWHGLWLQMPPKIPRKCPKMQKIPSENCTAQNW